MAKGQSSTPLNRMANVLVTYAQDFLLLPDLNPSAKPPDLYLH